MRRYGDHQITASAARLQNAVEGVAAELSALLEAGNPEEYRKALEWGRDEKVFDEMTAAQEEWKKQVRNAWAYLLNCDELNAVMDVMNEEKAV